MQPSYLSLLKDKVFEDRIEQAFKILANCELCPRKCHINRLEDKRGYCHTGRLARIDSYGSHHGEEKVLRGKRGSGTIFFSWCNMSCVYCQNWPISQKGDGRDVTDEKIAQIMLELQQMGCHNINLVSPTHVVPQILNAIYIASQNGLRLPIVYNTGGYDALGTIELLDGIIDIYLPDMKYTDDRYAKIYSNAQNYTFHNLTSVKEMYRQVGRLKLNEEGIAERGLLIRHLILPNKISGTGRLLSILREEFKGGVDINIMSQYHPEYKATEYKELMDYIETQEIYTAIKKAVQYGFNLCTS